MMTQGIWEASVLLLPKGKKLLLASYNVIPVVKTIGPLPVLLENDFRTAKPEAL